MMSKSLYVAFQIVFAIGLICVIVSLIFYNPSDLVDSLQSRIRIMALLLATALLSIAGMLAMLAAARFFYERRIVRRSGK